MCNRCYEKWLKKESVNEKKYIWQLLFLINSQSQLAFILLTYLQTQVHVLEILMSNVPANYTGKTLPDDQKLELLTVKVSFPHGFKFPTTAGRRFQLSWMEKRPWLHYSIRNDTAHCIYCICFSTNTVPNESPFISKGFKNWKKAGDERLDTHARSEEHQLSEEKMTNFLKTRHPGNDISARLQRQAAELSRATALHN